MAVTVWALRPERPLTEEETARLTALLPPERRERLVRQRVRAKREEALWAYGLLAFALRRQFDWERIPRIHWTEKGKPLFSDFQTVFFSLSHTEGAVLVGVADRPVGVDIERIRPVGRRLTERMGAESQEDFFRLWVRREARGKRGGEGIAPMIRAEPPMEPEERCFELLTYSGYAAGAAVTGETLPPEVRFVSPEELLNCL